MSDRIPGGYAELWMSFSLEGDPQLMYTSLGVEFTGASTQQSIDEMLFSFQNAIKGFCNSSYQIGPGHAIIGGGDFDDTRIDGSLGAVPGDNGLNVLPQNCAYLVKKHTAIGGRRGRGRMYIPGPTESEVGPTGMLQSSAVTAINTNLAQLMILLPSDTAATAIVLFHDSAPFTPTTITALTVQPQIATQRRRMRK